MRSSRRMGSSASRPRRRSSRVVGVRVFWMWAAMLKDLLSLVFRARMSEMGRFFRSTLVSRRSRAAAL